MSTAQANPYYDAALRYLESKHTTLWADWDITRPNRRQLAAAWLSEQVQGVLNTTKDEQNSNAQRSNRYYTDPAGTHVPGREHRESNKPYPGTAFIAHGQQPERF